MSEKNNKNQIEQDIKALVIARIDTISPDRQISIGSSGEFNKSELIKHIERGDEVGRKIIEVEMAFLRAQKEGLLFA